jgi:hypothetical protein
VIGFPAEVRGLTWGGAADYPSVPGCNRLGALVQWDAGWANDKWYVNTYWLVLSGLRLRLAGERRTITTGQPTDAPGGRGDTPFAGCPHLSRFNTSM